MIYVEAPNIITKYDKPYKKVFLGGGITNCPDWQSYVCERLKDKNLYVFNPRRSDFDINDSSASHIQIAWERKYLHEADIITFWFCKDTIQPIVLFELGKYGFNDRHKIIIGIEEGYDREMDVITQVKLEMPNIKFHRNLSDLADEVINTAFGKRFEGQTKINISKGDIRRL